jgi:hypothetical protein
MTQNPSVQELLVRGLDAIAKQTELGDLVNPVKNANCWIGMFAEVGGEGLAALETCDKVKRRGSQKTVSVVEKLRTTRHDSRALLSQLVLLPPTIIILSTYSTFFQQMLPLHEQCVSII